MRLNKKAIIVATCAACTLGLAAGCAPQQTSERADGAPETNDTAVKGEYQPFDPSVEAANTSGKAIEGSEEEELQQERIAGAPWAR